MLRTVSNKSHDFTESCNFKYLVFLPQGYNATKVFALVLIVSIKYQILADLNFMSKQSPYITWKKFRFEWFFFQQIGHSSKMQIWEDRIKFEIWVNSIISFDLRKMRKFFGGIVFVSVFLSQIIFISLFLKQNILTCFFKPGFYSTKLTYILKMSNKRGKKNPKKKKQYSWLQVKARVLRLHELNWKNCYSYVSELDVLF